MADTATIATICSAGSLALGTLIGAWAKHIRQPDRLLEADLAKDKRAKEAAEEETAWAELRRREAVWREELATCRAELAECRKETNNLRDELRKVEERYDLEMQRLVERYEKELKHVHEQKHEYRNQAQEAILRIPNLLLDINSGLRNAGSDLMCVMENDEVIVSTPKAE